MKPIIVVNFKTYLESTGENALKLAKAAEKASNEIILCVQTADIHRMNVNNPIFAQHVDNIMPDKNTGYILPESIKEAGASGTLLNHAEHRVNFENLKMSIHRCRSLGLKVIVCSDNFDEIKQLIELKPYAIAFEDPILIGSGQSITKSKQDDLKKFASLFHNTEVIPLCGAGISSGDDVREALKLGTKGVLVASGVVKSKDPEKLLREFL